MLLQGYLRRHETELLLYDGAENMLKRMGVDLKTLDLDKLRSDYDALRSKKESLQSTYKSAEKEIKAISRRLDNLNQYLGRTSPSQQDIDKQPNTRPTSL